VDLLGGIKNWAVLLTMTHKRGQVSTVEEGGIRIMTERGTNMGLRGSKE
jgi:hypothetical protein